MMILKNHARKALAWAGASLSAVTLAQLGGPPSANADELVPLPSGAAEVVTDVWEDGISTKPQALYFRDALRSAGYSPTTTTTGKRAKAAFEDAKAAKVLGYFGHASGGYMQTFEGGTADEALLAGVGQAAKLGQYPNAYEWMGYREFIDIDDVKLAVLAGCETSRTDDEFGSFPVVAQRMGVDSLVTFSGLVQSPLNCNDLSSTCDYSGNFFWRKVGQYLGSGRTIGVALSWARSDIIAKEGSDRKWGTYKITGTVASPETVRLSPAGNGQLATSWPTAGLPPLDEPPTAATVTRSEGLVQYEAPDVTLRTSSDGTLFDFHATPAQNGDVYVTKDDAIGAALRIAEDLGASSDDWSPISAEPMSHGDGQELFTVELASPARKIVVDIDRRTGDAVYVLNAFAPASIDPNIIEIDAARATEIAGRHLPEGHAITSVDLVNWDGAHWSVVSNNSDAKSGEYSMRVTAVDALTGRVLWDAAG